MGHDKALLPHPEGGTWLERQLRLLAEMGAPVSLLSGWPAHGERAAALAAPLAALGVELEALDDHRDPQEQDSRPQGPLVALGRLMEAHPDERLLLCPIDMPALTVSCLRTLLEAAEGDPGPIWIAAAERLQPLLGVYPSDASRRKSLGEALARRERGLRRWLAGEGVRSLPLPAAALANLNTPAELQSWSAHLKSRPDC